LAPDRPRVAIGIATCRRQAGLARLLDAINRLHLRDDEATVDIIVVDNDPAGSSRDVCVGRTAETRWPISYFVEPRPGIPFARNTIVSAAVRDRDAVVFIDDDETPERDWLHHLLQTWRQFGADVVAGPVLPRFEVRPPDWVIEGGFFEFPRYATGTVRDLAFTNNVLVAARVFHVLETWFDQRLQFNGGSDTLFFRRVFLAGLRIVWCDEAVVHDDVPPARATFGWVIQRSYRYGHTHAFVRADVKQDTRSRLAMTAVGRFRSVAISLILGVLRRQPARLIDAVRETAYIAGMLANLAGTEYGEYRLRETTSGSAGRH
jgi:succinoglycan biosynthesis protein ExoM